MTQKLNADRMARAMQIHRECMEDPEYAEKWNALMAQLRGVPMDIPDEARGDGSAITGNQETDGAA